MDKRIIRLIRLIYISFCIALGIISPLFCYILLPEFNITEHPLSYFGVVEKTNLFWQISLILISIGLYLMKSTNDFIEYKNKQIKKQILLNESFKKNKQNNNL